MPARTQSELYRELPSVDELLRSAELKESVARSGATAVTDAARMVLEKLRKEIAEGRLDVSALQAELKRLPEIIERELRESFSFSLRSVINATGGILHSNLGRAPLWHAASAHVQKVQREARKVD